MNKKTLLSSLLLALVFTGCARREDSTADEVTTPEKSPEQQAVDTRAAAEAAVPAATISPVTVNISLTPQAEAALKAKSEKIAVVATYSGDPKASAQGMADTSGMIKLGENKQTLDGAGSLTFQDDVIDKNKLGHTVGEVQLTINVTSSKTVTPENLLACPFYWDTLESAGKQNVQISCKALSE